MASYTNLLLHSEEFDDADWTSTVTVTANQGDDVQGNPLADKLNDASFPILQDIRQAVTINGDAAPYTFSIFIEKDADTGRFPVFEIAFTGGTNYALTLNTSTGAFQVTNGKTAPDDLGVEDYDATHWRIWVTVHNSGQTTVTVIIYPAWAATIGGGSDPNEQGFVIASWAQLVKDENRGPYVKTTDAAATIAAPFTSLARIGGR